MKRKLEEEQPPPAAQGENGEPAMAPRALEGFSVHKQLNCLTDKKTVFLHVKKTGEDGEEKDGVVILEKTPFDESSARVLLEDNRRVDSGEVSDFTNDVYCGMSVASGSDHVNSVKATLIFPATEKHILKYTSQERFFFEETAEIYEKHTKQFSIEQASNCQWVHNVLEKKSESERIIFEDADPENGFILMPGMRWDSKDLNNLHVIAIVHRRDLFSLRSLNSSHLPLLRNIQSKCLEAIVAKYGVKRDKVRVFVHYRPTYYHLHVHFTAIGVEGAQVHCERAHMLTDVIENIQLDSEYYSKRTLTFAVAQQDPLMTIIKDLQ